ncbi:hypothetical protein [Acidovorax soli]|uniref:Uncharacterized protein n=1 Tax=Acidovorax soli TaxID=592050 RepID=A0A1H4F4T5_9BURK|nr:hypothetical protein [Acidovorax soli]SEA91798.1 hypothetical protein SAMN05421875_14711 [Acidovorax soli]
MHCTLENAPSKTGNPSGGGRGNNPPRNRITSSAGWPSKTGEPSGGGRDNGPARK